MPRSLFVGAWCALRTPVWLRGHRLASLLAPPGGARRSDRVPRPARNTAGKTLRVLAYLPGSLWRNTCLYRSVAECLVLRHYGAPAYIRLGVRRDADERGKILAHAWVVSGSGDAEEDAVGVDGVGYERLERS